MQDVVRDLLGLLRIEHPNLDNLLCAAAAIGIDEAGLVKDLEHVVAERIYMWLVSHVDGQLNFVERKNVVRQRLNESCEPTVLSPTELLEQLVKTIASAQARIAEARGTGKIGRGSVYEHEWECLLQQQGYRCRVCGVPLSERVRGECVRFSDGLEPTGEPTLDHVLPFYLGSNLGNLQLLCRNCNSLKNDFAGVQEDGIVLSGNFLRERRGEQVRRRMMFWTLWKTKKCAIEECRRAGEESLLWIGRHSNRRPFAYGNLMVFCTDHAPTDAVWIHEEM
jgi:hypothetical protein